MEKYKILGIKKRTSKAGKDYFVCFLSLETDLDFNVINVMIEEKQIDIINQSMKADNFDVSKFLKLKYNTYQKQYQLDLTLGK